MNYYISTPASMVEARRRMMNRFLNENRSEEPVFSIPMNLYSNQDEYLLTSFVPGLEADSLNIHFNNGVLTLEGEYAEKQVQFRKNCGRIKERPPYPSHPQSGRSQTQNH